MTETKQEDERDTSEATLAKAVKTLLQSCDV